MNNLSLISKKIISLKKNSFSVDFIIPAYNAEATLESCLKSILALNKADYNLNILVVDNNSTDNTSELARQMGVRVILCPQQGRSNARNFGLLNTSSEYVAFIDSDVTLDQDWLLNLGRVFTQRCIGAAQGKIIPEPEKDFVDRFLYSYKKDLTHGHFIETEANFKNLPLIDTAASLYRREALLSVNGFDESLAMHEDRDCTIRLIAKGHSIRNCFNAIAYKQANRTPLEFLYRTAKDAKIFAQYTVQHTKPILAYHLWFAFFWSSTYFYPHQTWPIFFYTRVYHLVGKITYILFYAYYYFQRLPKLIIPMPPSKLNLLLPQISHPISSEVYVFSPYKRFSISDRTLIIYMAGELPERISDMNTVKWFNNYLNNSEIGFKEQDQEIILKLIKDEVFILENKLLTKKH